MENRSVTATQSERLNPPDTPAELLVRQFAPTVQGNIRRASEVTGSAELRSGVLGSRDG